MELDRVAIPVRGSIPGKQNVGGLSSCYSGTGRRKKRCAEDVGRGVYAGSWDVAISTVQEKTAVLAKTKSVFGFEAVALLTGSLLSRASCDEMRAE